MGQQPSPATSGEGPDRPWVIYVDGAPYGDYRTEADQLAAIAEAAAAGGVVTTAHWDPDGERGPGWTEPAHTPASETAMYIEMEARLAKQAGKPVSWWD
jgi:hypothetical protein